MERVSQRRPNVNRHHPSVVMAPPLRGSALWDSGHFPVAHSAASGGRGAGVGGVGGSTVWLHRRSKLDSGFDGD